MSRIHPVRIVLVLLVAAVLAAPPAWGQPAERQDGFTARISGAFVFFGDLLTALWAEVGCILDPHGGSSSDLDTSGAGDEGCGIDPHGCTDGSEGTTQGDAGCGLDPHGACGG